MARQAMATNRQRRGRGESDYALRVRLLEAQMSQLMLEHYGRASDRERYDELRQRARALGGELEKTFCFDESGKVPAAMNGLARVSYRRSYWLMREEPGLIATVGYDLPRQFGQLELALVRDERTFQQKVRNLAYAGERPVARLMLEPALEPRLKKLAMEAGGSLELKAYNGKTYAYYYRYTRLKTATVFNSLLKHAPYHTSGKHRYTFWLPIDYVLLRQMLEKDAEIYAALPEEMRRPGYPACVDG